MSLESRLYIRNDASARPTKYEERVPRRGENSLENGTAKIVLSLRSEKSRRRLKERVREEG